MSEIAIHQLPVAAPLTGGEIIPVDDGTATKRTTVTDVRAGLAAAVHGHGISDVSGLQTGLNAKAPLASPSFTGTVGMAAARVVQTAGYTAAFGENPSVQISQQRGAHPAPLALYTWGADNIGPRLVFAKSRGASIGAQALPVAGDELGGLYFCGSNGTTMNDAAASIVAAADGAPGATSNMPGRLVFATTAAGAAAPTERLRIANDGAVTHRANATVVIDAASHLGLRAYTVATLPSAAAAARLIYVSDGAAGKRLAVSDGAAWRWPDGGAVS